MTNVETMLRGYVQEIEAVEAEKAKLGEQSRDIYASLKAAGFNPKAVRRLIARRKMDAGERAQLDMLMAEYSRVLGMEDLA